MARTGRPREFDEDVAVDAAKELFWERGYGSTSLDDLTEALGVKRGSLYAAFGDKRGLFQRALDRYVETNASGLAVLEGGPVLPRLRELLLWGINPTDRSQPRGCLAGNTAIELAPSDSDAVTTVRRWFDQLETAFRVAIQRAQQNGELPGTGDPAAQALMLLALVEGLQVLAKVDADRSRLQAAVDAALAALR